MKAPSPASLLSLLLLLCDHCQADMAHHHRRQEHPHHHTPSDQASPSVASATPTDQASSSDTINHATVPTPISTALLKRPIPLFVPEIDAAQKMKDGDVYYFGPGNGGSTVYHVIMTDPVNAAPVTATLIEDATNAELIGAQRIKTISGVQTAVYAAASCGFSDGLEKEPKSKAAGYCVYWDAVDRVTSTYSSAATPISAQTTIKPMAATKQPFQGSERAGLSSLASVSITLPTSFALVLPLCMAVFAALL